MEWFLGHTATLEATFVSTNRAENQFLRLSLQTIKGDCWWVFKVWLLLPFWIKAAIKLNFELMICQLMQRPQTQAFFPLVRKRGPCTSVDRCVGVPQRYEIILKTESLWCTRLVVNDLEQGKNGLGMVVPNVAHRRGGRISADHLWLPRNVVGNAERCERLKMGAVGRKSSQIL